MLGLMLLGPQWALQSKSASGSSILSWPNSVCVGVTWNSVSSSRGRRTLPSSAAHSDPDLGADVNAQTGSAQLSALMRNATFALVLPGASPQSYRLVEVRAC